MNDTDSWPALSLAEWRPTYETLHLWSQIVGKIRLATTPLINHWWNTSFYITARGMTTSAMPHGNGAFQIDFDFIDHRLDITTSSGDRRTIALRSIPCADFYAAVMDALRTLKIDIKISPVTAELPQPVRLDLDRQHATYVADHAHRWWRITLSTAMVFQDFRGRFIGKSSPVHFFWGGFDLAVTRFSGRRAPPRPGADSIQREGYSHEVMSVGFWPGSGTITDMAFYAYAAPQPEGFDQALPGYNRDFNEYILMYEDTRKSASPRKTLLEFAQSTYEAAARLAHWNRAELERS